MHHVPSEVDDKKFLEELKSLLNKYNAHIINADRSCDDLYVWFFTEYDGDHVVRKSKQIKITEEEYLR